MLDQYVPIAIQDLIAGSQIPVDLFVRINDQKYLMIFKANSKIDREQLNTYEKKTIEYLWIRDSDYSKFVKNHLNIAGILVTKDQLMVNQRSQILTQAASSVFNQFDNMGFGLEAYNNMKQIVDSTLVLTENHRDLSALFEGLKNCSDDLIRHSMGVCMVSVLVAHALGWENKQTIEKLALGALLHDIGLKAIPPELLKKPKAKMTFDEVQTFEQHSFKGMQMLVSLGIVPDDVIAVVYEHHENALGQGYPRKLRNLKLHPLSKVAAVADDFCTLTLANPNCPIPKNPREALMTIEITMGQPHNKETFKALQMLIVRDFSLAA